MISEESSGQGVFDINEDLRELIPHFVVHQFDELHLMESSLEAGDYEAVGRLGHSLKGAAANFCLEPLDVLEQLFRMFQSWVCLKRLTLWLRSTALI